MCSFFLSVFCLSEKTPPTLYPYSEGFCTKLFSKNFLLTFNCTIFTAFVRNNFGCRKNPLITDRDKNRSFDSLFSKNSEFFAVQNIPLFNPTELCVLSGVLTKKSPHCIDHGKAFFRSPFEKIHRSFTFLHLRCLVALLRKSPLMW